MSTLNKTKLGQQCAKLGIEVPDVESAPHAVRGVEAERGAAALEVGAATVGGQHGT